MHRLWQNWHQKMGVPVAVFEQTVNEYNAGVRRVEKTRSLAELPCLVYLQTLKTSKTTVLCPSLYRLF